MAKKRPPLRSVKTVGKNFVEWVGGAVSMPGYVDEEGEPFRPEVLIWLSDDGLILGSALVRPDEVLRVAPESLQNTIDQPAAGAAHAPSHLRVASEALAVALRAAHPDIEIICAATPELDAVAQSMQEHFANRAEGKQTYLGSDVTPAAMGSFFMAAAALYRKAPWKMVPSDSNLFAVSIERFEIHNAVLAVIGQKHESFGFLLFNTLLDYLDYLNAAAVMSQSDKPVLPAHLVLSYERGAALSHTQRKEIAAHHWEVAAVNAYPAPLFIDGDLSTREPSAKETTILEAIARALAAVVPEKSALRKAWKGGEAITRTLAVQTIEGEVAVTLRAPYPRTEVDRTAFTGVLADLAELETEGDEIDPDAREYLERRLIRKFRASPEGEGLRGGNPALVMRYGAENYKKTIGSLDDNELYNILFRLYPFSASVEPRDAEWIIDEMRAFYRFLEREYALAHAGLCLRVLGGAAVQELEKALGDRSLFDPSKARFTGPFTSPTGVEKSLPKKKSKRKTAKKKPKKKR